MGEPHQSSQLSQPLMATPLQHHKGQCLHSYNTIQARAKVFYFIVTTPQMPMKLHSYNTIHAHAMNTPIIGSTLLNTPYGPGSPITHLRKHSQHVELEVSQMSHPGPSLLLLAQWTEILSATCLLETDNPLSRLCKAGTDDQSKVRIGILVSYFWEFVLDRWQPQSNQPHCDAVTLEITLSIAMSSLSVECV
ncbi:hypothetical protein Fmac_030879 [Flemingia macrophylla]|uniref:Uncharacterized protein n=1 Tax=Flemingia macrophylla TaxID=520843 RepID=A0ABD1L0Y3_9FABA